VTSERALAAFGLSLGAAVEAGTEVFVRPKDMSIFIA
jgi:hypothetical protein